MQGGRVAEDMHGARLRVERDAPAAEGLDAAALRLELGGGRRAHVAVVVARRAAHPRGGACARGGPGARMHGAGTVRAWHAHGMRMAAHAKERPSIGGALA